MNGRPEICLIAAMSRNRVIGSGGKLPWRMPADMQFFKKTTLGHTILMGRKTFETFPSLLPDRRHIVLTTQNNYDGRGAEVVGSMDEALDRVAGESRLYVIGGQQIYELALPLADRVLLTLIETDIEGGDAFFPTLDPGQWTLIESRPRPADEKNPHGCTFLTYQRKPTEA